MSNKSRRQSGRKASSQHGKVQSQIVLNGAARPAPALVDPEIQEEIDQDPEPDHPHYQGLKEAVERLTVHGKGATIAEVMATANIDAASVLHMARRRSKVMMMAMSDRPLPEGITPERDLEGKVAAIWADAFLVGLMTGDGRSLPIDGNRRSEARDAPGEVWPGF